MINDYQAEYWAVCLPRLDEDGAKAVAEWANAQGHCEFGYAINPKTSYSRSLDRSSVELLLRLLRADDEPSLSWEEDLEEWLAQADPLPKD
jgi:hypothetical protein